MIPLAALGRRLLMAVPALLVVSLLLFAALRVLPADPDAMLVPPAAAAGEVAQARSHMGLDRSLPVQYALWLGQALSGDFGRSVHLRRPVGELLAAALPATIELAVLAMVLAGALGVAGGLLLFALRGDGGDGDTAGAIAEAGTSLLLSVPAFLWALLLILVFGVALEVLPFTGRLAPDIARPAAGAFLLPGTLLAGKLRAFLSAAQHMVLPALALGLAFAPPVMRMLRAALVDIYRQDHIRQARLRGLSEARVLGHALCNAALPVLGLVGALSGALFGGALLVEVIFAYPGMGSLLVDAVRNADLPTVQAAGLAYGAVVLLINALAEGLSRALNPRLGAR